MGFQAFQREREPPLPAWPRKRLVYSCSRTRWRTRGSAFQRYSARPGRISRALNGNAGTLACTAAKADGLLMLTHSLADKGVRVPTNFCSSRPDSTRIKREPRHPCLHSRESGWFTHARTLVAAKFAGCGRKKRRPSRQKRPPRGILPDWKGSSLNGYEVNPGEVTRDIDSV